MGRTLVVAAAIGVISAPALAQTDDAGVRRLGEAEEVALARSAAPPHVSEDATVLVLRDGRFVEAVRGESRVTCMVSRSRPGSLEPICYDEEGARTILRIELRRHDLSRQGLSDEEIDARIAEEIGKGLLRVPSRPAMTYMMSAGQKLVSDDGREVGNWLPHLMIYYPYVSAADLGLFGPPDMSAAAVFDEGTATAHIVIAVRDFVEPEAGREEAR